MQKRNLLWTVGLFAVPFSSCDTREAHVLPADMAFCCHQEGVRNMLLHALGSSRAKESLCPYRVFLRLQVDDEQLCDTPHWDGGQSVPTLPAGPQRDGDAPSGSAERGWPRLPAGRGRVRLQIGCQKRNALTERRQGSKLRFPKGFGQETKTLLLVSSKT